MILDALGEIRLTHPMELIAEILASGTSSVTVTLSDPKTYGEAAFDEALQAIEAYDRHIQEHSEYLSMATSVEDVDRAVERGRLAIFYQFQNSTPLQKDLDRVDHFYELGVRSIQLTYNYQNYVGSGCRERDNRGITTFGIELIERMNARGMLIDTSHASMATMADAIETSKQPIIVSHTACESVHHHVRNTTDENLRRLADKGGLVGICQIRPFLTMATSENLGAYFDHIDHAVNIAGIDHVCIGSDRDHRVIEDTPEEIRKLQEEEGPQFQPDDWPLYISELNGPRRMEVVVAGLSRRGYSDDAIEKISSKNLYRLYSEVFR
ncbi:MAG TPA: membrane dipeptidase [Vicinamibacteria bacterium]|nr:membrane dipeptidase [Vicinamibacteria bacterium]